MKCKVKKLYILLLLILTTSIMSGCWDYFEVEQRGYVLGVAIDRSSIIDKGKENEIAYNRELEEMEVEEGNTKYAYTIQVPITARAQIQPSGQGGSDGGGKKKVWNLTVAGNSFFEAQREYSTRIDYPPFFEHIQAIVISEDVARRGIIEPLDMLARDSEMRRRVKVFVTSGEARKLLDIEPKIDDYSSVYLANLTDNISKTSRMAQRTDLGGMAKSLHSNRSFILPRVTTNGEEVKCAGGAVFKKGKMVGWIGGLDVNYVNWAADSVKGGTIVVPMPDHPGDLLTFEISKADTKVRPEVSDGNITLHIKSNVKVNIAEQLRDDFYNTFYEEFVNKSQKAAEEKVAKGMKDTIEYVQREYGADVFFFYNAMERYAPDTWDSVKDNWDEVFKEVKLNIDVDVKITQRGLIK
ncbi:MAG: hypothetical protein K0R09_1827 [Clostridiales bacterium]|nr:hypothetical protein [Clostridiales bacterium]